MIFRPVKPVKRPSYAQLPEPFSPWPPYALTLGSGHDAPALTLGSGENDPVLTLPKFLPEE